MKELFINGIGNISPQKTWDNNAFLEDVTAVETNCLHTLDPNYKDYIQGDMVRRMSRIIKMGIAAGKICLADAACVMPDAIITGTGLGCVEDTEKFLTNMIRNNEEFLTPTSFIQSTHNTVSAQIALLLKCHNYNFTFVHRGFSFESALLDSFLKIDSGEAETVLLGGLDEMTANTFTILQRLGQAKQKPVNNLTLFTHPTRGTIAGEGATFFLVSANPGVRNYTKIVAMDMFYKPEKEEIGPHILQFLEKNGIGPGTVLEDVFRDTPSAVYKHLSGEYQTVSAFSLWLGAMIMKYGNVPEVVRFNGKIPGPIRNILLYNHYMNIDHSLILLSAT
jgi:hypothetical protein